MDVEWANDDANSKISNALACSALKMKNIPTTNTVPTSNRSNLISTLSAKINMQQEILSICINGLRNYQYIV